MTPEQDAYIRANRLGCLYDRLVVALKFSKRETYQELIDILGEFNQDDVKWMMNVILEDISNAQ